MKTLQQFKEIIKTLPTLPGVYRMVDKDGRVLYVGKAKNIKKRVTSYSRIDTLPHRLKRMVSLIDHVEVITTQTENEALLLENNLIKQYMPPYNILLKDDKAFPYIYLRTQEKFPQIMKYRGTDKKKGKFFGPYASVQSVNETLVLLQKAFLLRSCSDTIFNNRDRPCLLYQIKRCSAPCVGFINKKNYDELIHEAARFLKGDISTIQKSLSDKMFAASEKLDYERAKIYRDRIRALATVQSHQFIHGKKLENDADIIAVAVGKTASCAQVFFYRHHQNLGNAPFYFEHDADVNAAEIIAAFIKQFYEKHTPPKDLFISHPFDDQKETEKALTELHAKKIKIHHPRQGDKKSLMEHALKNALQALERKMLEEKDQSDLFNQLKDQFRLEATPERIEIYDNSHISGASAVGAMVVANKTGFLKKAYRKFNVGIKEAIIPGDDYAMMREVFKRRFTRALKEDPDRSKGEWPDLVFIDGGKGQLSAATETLADLGITDVPLIAVAKGKERNKGKEQFFREGNEKVTLSSQSPVLYLIQRLRDEAHRFAIGSHRQKRAAGITRSILDEIPGIGPKRKKALLLHFGSAKDVAKASLEDLRRAPGISFDIAQKIADYLRLKG